MSEVDISVARKQMGRALGGWVVSSKMSHQVLPGSWHFLSGLPAADVNMAMVHADDNDELTSVLKEITRMNVPTYLFLAAEGKKLSSQLPGEWKQVGIFPLMTKELDETVREFDPRVSLISADDVNDVVKLLADSFLLDRSNFGFLFDTLKNPDSVSNIWILKEDGVAVSTVTTMLVDDALTVWCMATPPQFARKGYGKALLGDVLLRCGAKGAKRGSLGATEAGKPLYEASGWETLEGWDVYLNGFANH